VDARGQRTGKSGLLSLLMRSIRPARLPGSRCQSVRHRAQIAPPADTAALVRPDVERRGVFDSVSSDLGQGSAKRRRIGSSLVNQSLDFLMGLSLRSSEVWQRRVSSSSRDAGSESGPVQPRRSGLRSRKVVGFTPQNFWFVFRY